MGQRISTTNDDTKWHGLALTGRGLLLDVPHEGRWRRRPSLLVEVDPATHGLLRVVSGERPLLSMRIGSGWDECGFLRGQFQAPWALPPLSASDVRAVRQTPLESAWWLTWAHRLVRSLDAMEATLLHSGRWCIRPLRVVPQAEAHAYPNVPSGEVGGLPDPPHSLAEALHFRGFWIEGWGDWPKPVKSGLVLSLRAPSSLADGRVKAWRKTVGDGTLPPVLLLYFQLAGKWLVVDGHDRLHAALAEGREPPLLGLWPVVEERLPVSPHQREGALQGAERILRGAATPAAIDSVNRMLLTSFETRRRRSVTRAWPLRGGAQAWLDGVMACRTQLPERIPPEDWAWFVGGL